MKTLVLCNGRPPAPNLFAQIYAWSEFFIAADGGGNVARTFNTQPDLVIGDLDSFIRHQTDTFEITHNPDQETNDLEKALEAARTHEASEVIVLGATGLRLDQTLKNLSVLKQFNNYFRRLEFKDEYNEIILLPKTFTTELPAGTQVSLFPLSGTVKGIRTKGLKFPLNNESLVNGVRDGSSNTVIASPVKISYEEGDLVFFTVQKEVQK